MSDGSVEGELARRNVSGSEDGGWGSYASANMEVEPRRTIKKKEWLPDRKVKRCMHVSENFAPSKSGEMARPVRWQCPTVFSLRDRRHHCRNCGGIFCSFHTGYFARTASEGSGRMRLCNNCFSLCVHPAEPDYISNMDVETSGSVEAYAGRGQRQKGFVHFLSHAEQDQRSGAAETAETGPGINASLDAVVSGVELGLDASIAYVIDVRCEKQGRSWTVRRRHGHFLELFQKMDINHDALPQGLPSHNDPAAVNAMRSILNDFIRMLLTTRRRSKRRRRSDILYNFLYTGHTVKDALPLTSKLDWTPVLHIVRAEILSIAAREPYVAFVIVTQVIDGGFCHTATVKRRYKFFEVMSSQLAKRFPHLKRNTLGSSFSFNLSKEDFQELPSLPGKSRMRSFEPVYIEEKRRALEIYLRALLAIDCVRCSEELRTFLSGQPRRPGEHVTEEVVAVGSMEATVREAEKTVAETASAEVESGLPTLLPPDAKLWNATRPGSPPTMTSAALQNEATTSPSPSSPVQSPPPPAQTPPLPGGTPSPTHTPPPPSTAQAAQISPIKTDAMSGGTAVPELSAGASPLRSTATVTNYTAVYIAKLIAELALTRANLDSTTLENNRMHESMLLLSTQFKRERAVRRELEEENKILQQRLRALESRKLSQQHRGSWNDSAGQAKKKYASAERGVKFI